MAESRRLEGPDETALASARFAHGGTKRLLELAIDTEGRVQDGKPVQARVLVNARVPEWNPSVLPPMVRVAQR